MIQLWLGEKGELIETFRYTGQGVSDILNYFNRHNIAVFIKYTNKSYMMMEFSVPQPKLSCPIPHTEFKLLMNSYIAIYTNRAEKDIFIPTIGIGTYWTLHCSTKLKPSKNFWDHVRLD